MLLSEAAEILKKMEYMPADIVFTSEQIRSRQTAGIVYPHIDFISLKSFNEMDFGDFEYKNYIDLKNDRRYQDYINSNGTISFPNGENIADFKKRCVDGFVKSVKMIQARKRKAAAYVLHGGSIMSILEEFARPRKGYFEWQIENNGAYVFEMLNKESCCRKKIELHLIKRIYCKSTVEGDKRNE